GRCERGVDAGLGGGHDRQAVAPAPRRELREHRLGRVVDLDPLLSGHRRNTGAVTEGVTVSTYAGVVQVLQQVDTFVGSFMDTSVLPEDEVMISAVPEPRHGRIRRVINGAIAPHKTAKVEPYVRDLARRLLDEALR